VAEIAPELARRLKLKEKPQRAIPLTLAELKAVKEKARGALQQTGTGRRRIPLEHVFQACAQALDQHLGAAALREEGGMDWFLGELRAVADRYRWQYVAPDRQQHVEQIAYRIWQEEGCPPGRHEDHWRRAEKEFLADKPIRGAPRDDTDAGRVGPLLSPLQAVVHARTVAVHAVPAIVEGAGFPVTPGEAGVIEAAADGALAGHDPALRAGIARAVGLET
jgi:hypothetical protein